MRVRPILLWAEHQALALSAVFVPTIDNWGGESFTDYVAVETPTDRPDGIQAPQETDQMFFLGPGIQQRWQGTGCPFHGMSA